MSRDDLSEFSGIGGSVILNTAIAQYSTVLHQSLESYFLSLLSVVFSMVVVLPFMGLCQWVLLRFCRSSSPFFLSQIPFVLSFLSESGGKRLSGVTLDLRGVA